MLVTYLSHRTTEGYPGAFSYYAFSSLHPQFDTIVGALVDDGTKLCLDLDLCATSTQLGGVWALQDVKTKKSATERDMTSIGFEASIDGSQGKGCPPNVKGSFAAT